MKHYTPSIDEKVIDDAIQARLQLFSKTPYDRENDVPFFVADMKKIVQQHQRWRSALPNIHPFYGQLLFIHIIRTRLTKSQRSNVTQTPNFCNS